MRKVLFLVMLLACVCANGQTVQKGVVYEYHGREDKTPLAGVVINAGGATAKSNTYGNFKLSFNNLKVGDRVVADPDNCALLKNYIVFNIDAVQQWNVSSSGNMFTIVLCRKDKFDKMVMTYYNASDKSLKQQLKREQERAKQALKEQQIQKAEYEQLLEEAEQRYQQATESMQQNAELVARIDESELEGNQAKILELASQGKLDEAVELIMQDSTAILLERVAKKRNYSSEQRQLYEQKEAEAKSEIEALIANLKNNIKVLKLAGGKENYDKCGEYWQLIVAADTTNLDNTWACASFFHRQGELQLAERYFLSAIRIARELSVSKPTMYNIELAKMCSELSLIYTLLNRYEEAEKYSNEAVAKCKESEMSGGEECKIELSTALFALAQIQEYYYKDYKATVNLYNQAIGIMKEIAKSKPEYIAYLAELYWHLSDLYSEIGENAKSVESIRQALSKTIECEQYYPNSNMYKSLHAQIMLALVRNDQSIDADKASEYLEQALGIYEKLSQSNPKAYNSEYAEVLCEVGEYYQKSGTEALKYYIQAVEIYRDINESQPEIGNRLMVARKMKIVGDLYMSVEKYDSANQYYTSVLEMYELDSSMYMYLVAEICELQIQMSRLFILTSHFVDAEQHSNKVIEVDTLQILNSNIAEPMILRSYVNTLIELQNKARVSLTLSSLCQGKYAEAEKIALEIKDVEYEGQLLKEYILDELKTLEEKSVIPEERKADVERLRGVLK